MASEPTVDKTDLYIVLQRLRDVRAWAVRIKIDPWAFRQALLTVLRIDTRAAFDRGVKRGALQRFDDLVRLDIDEVIERFK